MIQLTDGFRLGLTALMVKFAEDNHLDPLILKDAYTLILAIFALNENTDEMLKSISEILGCLKNNNVTKH